DPGAAADPAGHPRGDPDPAQAVSRGDPRPGDGVEDPPEPDGLLPPGPRLPRGRPAGGLPPGPRRRQEGEPDPPDGRPGPAPRTRGDPRRRVLTRPRGGGGPAAGAPRPDAGRGPVASTADPPRGRGPIPDVPRDGDPPRRPAERPPRRPALGRRPDC